MASNRQAATANPILTNFAQGLTQDIAAGLADFLAPPVQVSATIGHFKKFDDKNMFQVPDSARAIGGPARRIEFDASDPTYNCKPQALEIAIDDAEREAAGSEDPIIVEQAKTRVLVNAAILSHESKVIAAVKAGVSAVSGRGEWSNAAIDPIDQIDEQIEAIVTTCGRMPNRIALGIGAWRKLRANTKVKSRVAGNALSFNLQDFAAVTLNPSIEIKVGVLAYDTTKFPATKSSANIVGDECFLFYASPTPSTYDPSFAKTFMGGNRGITAVYLYRADSNRSDILALDWSEDIQVIATSCVKRLSIT